MKLPVKVGGGTHEHLEARLAQLREREKSLESTVTVEDVRERLTTRLRADAGWFESRAALAATVGGQPGFISPDAAQALVTLAVIADPDTLARLMRRVGAEDRPTREQRDTGLDAVRRAVDQIETELKCRNLQARDEALQAERQEVERELATLAEVPKPQREGAQRP